MKIVLSDDECDVVRFIAQNRFSRARKRGQENKKIGKQSNEITEVHSVGAEFAFCKHFNIFPSFCFVPDAGYDCITPSGLTVDVKQTVLPYGKLVVKQRENLELKAQIYALVVGSLPNFEYVGFTIPAVVRQYANANLGYGLCHAVPQSALFLDNCDSPLDNSFTPK